MNQKDWDGLFSEQAFSFRFAARPGDPRQFFAESADHERRMRLRREILATNPQRHLFQAPASRAAVAELVEWAGIDGDCFALALYWEQDFMLLLPDKGEDVVVAGAVCFPSSWEPETKQGLPVYAIHEAVPTLNARLGARIGSFLASIQPERAWKRVNWGLSGVADLNQHAAIGIPRLAPPFALEQVWLRREDQLLFRLPGSGALVFGIQVTPISVAEIAADAEGRSDLHRAIETMPDEIAAYKGLSAARQHLLQLLE
jgi:hypothetical protein